MAYTAIDNPELYFQIKLYTGDGSTPSITLDGDEDMQPDLVWIKNRDEADSHCLFDSVRGATKLLSSDATSAETTDADTLTSFDSDGFALGADVKVNTDTEAYVAWCWKETATAGFDIVEFTTSGDDENHSHSLSAKPHLILMKPKTSANWITQQKGTDGNLANDYMLLHATDAEASDGSFAEPTTSVFSTSNNIAPDAAHVAYLWTSIQGYSKIDRYIGNGNADGTFVYTGFRPSFTIIKRTDTTNSWMVGDNKINPYNVTNYMMRADLPDAQQSGNTVDYLSNGFKIRVAGNAFNASGGTYIYMAFAEAPFVNSNGVPCNAR